MHPEAVAYSVEVGRIWSFLTQDANAAMDRMGQPYVRFVLGHRLIMWTSYVVLLFLIGVFVNTTLALVLAGIMLALLAYGVATALWRRHLAR
jgi:hypothetical protein